MPTPFMHLHTAEQILSTMINSSSSSSSSSGNGRILSQLQESWPAFYMGSVAPDVNAICDIARSATHFYEMPPDPQLEAYAKMLVTYPDLACGCKLPPDKAVFVAAYSAHLLLDLVWLREIVYPFFVQADQWGDRTQRRLTHFILLTYLDTLALEALPETAVSTLANAQPQQWVPFITDDILVAWRDMLVEQLYPAAPIKTVEIYAERLDMSAAEFATNLQDAQWMAEQVFGKIPVNEVQARLTQAVPRSIEIISDYLQFE